jgi:hypothetical protein
MTQRVTIFFLLFLALCLVATAPAQTTFGTITGTITDVTGAVIPSAPVTVTNEETGVARRAMSAASGVYTIVDLQPGSYKLAVEAKGFVSAERSGLVLFANRVLNIDLQLNVGASATQISVSGDAPLVNTETATTTFTKVASHLESMPILARQAHGNLQPAIYNPGANVNGSANIYANGIRQLDAYMSNDGIVEMADPVGIGGGQIGPDIDAVAQISYILANSPAEFKSPVNFTTISKSGTNQFHGSAFYEINNTIMNARNFFAASVPVHVYNDWVLAFGGPIRRNKTFFFADFDDESNHGQGIVTANTPLAAWRNGVFPTAVKDPTTGQNFPNNTIPAARISPVAQKSQEYFFPLANFGPPTLQAGNWRSVNPTIGVTKTMDGRIDHNISERDSLFGRFSYKRVNAQSSSNFMPPLGTGHQQRDSGTSVLSWTHTFSPNLINEARTGYARNSNRTNPNLVGSDILSQLGISGITTQGAKGLPFINITGITGTNQPTGGEALDTDFQWTDNVSWTRGAHAMKFGIDVIRDQIGGGTLSNIYGTYNFTTAFTGVAYADFLLGLPQTTGSSIPTPNQYLRGTMWSAYAQDQWKVSPRLTLTYGLRYELAGPYHDKFGRIFSFDPKNGSLVLPASGIPNVNPLYPRNIAIESATQAGYPEDSLVRFPKHNFYPRVGAAYKLTADGKAAIRAGYGIYGNTIYGSLAQALVGGPFAGSQTLTNVITNGNPLLTFANPFPSTVAGRAATLQNVTGIYPNIRTPYTQQWNVTIEKQLGPFAFSAAYIGTHSVQILYPRNLNQPVPSTSPFKGFLYQGLNTITWVDNGGSASYNSLQLSAAKTVGKSLTFTLGYTLAKDLTDQLDNAGFAGQMIQNAYDRRIERGNNTYVPRQRFFSDTAWSLPVGAGRPFLSHLPHYAEAIIGGWRLSTIVTLQTGQWFTPRFQGTDPSNTNNIGGRADVISGVSVIPAGGQTIANWINLGAFAVPGCPASNPVCNNPANVGRFGNAGNTILQGPHMRNLDLALMKDFRLRERFILQLDGNFGNIFNHANFGNPSANISSPATGAVITSTLGNYLQGSPPARAIYVMLRLKF